MSTTEYEYFEVEKSFNRKNTFVPASFVERLESRTLKLENCLALVYELIGLLMI